MTAQALAIVASPVDVRPSVVRPSSIHHPSINVCISSTTAWISSKFFTERPLNFFLQNTTFCNSYKDDKKTQTGLGALGLLLVVFVPHHADQVTLVYQYYIESRTSLLLHAGSCTLIWTGIICTFREGCGTTVWPKIPSCSFRSYGLNV